MAGLDGLIQVQTLEYRPCIVKSKGNIKALFHKWSEVARIRDAIMVGTVSGQIKETLAIVEYEDGTVEQCYPNDIRFCDDKFAVERIMQEDSMETCNACSKGYNPSITGGVVNGHPFCQDCIIGMTEESIKLDLALDKACEDAADDCCPHEYGLYECDKCTECPHDGELHTDTERDAECWKKYYLSIAFDSQNKTIVRYL